ncbi:MAG TPA: TrkH family potassium uptake protein [Candidatus Hydrogenedentes bacterium]|mgnify:CR=1 FL=1|nr:TrkH family potassium uptake protein [Candidatus Hydrogenedentota bacterium]HQM48852.1 TrkH family potassium uptake protein [Candidatus Hydrogenedentota bacterium]
MLTLTLNYRFIAKWLGTVALISGCLFLPSIGWAIYYGEYAAIPGILLASAIAWACGGVFSLIGRKASNRLFQREALAIVALSWVVIGLLGALPFICTDTIGPAGAIFESISGFTTTGASVLDNVEAVPKSILFWRSFTHWLGGMGIILLFITVLPYLGAGGKLLVKTESSGPDPKAVRPRVKQSAVILFKIYLGLTVIQVVALLCTGKMDLFESICHAFGALATGGFSTRQMSIAAYDSVAVEIIIIASMISGATSFALYVGILDGNWKSLFQNTEWRALILVLTVSTLLVALNAAGYLGEPQLTPPGAAAAAAASPPSFAHALRASAFSVTSMMTNTGYTTDDYDTWPYFSRMLLVVLMFIGGSAGSTAGGMKVIRSVMLLKMLRHRLETTFCPYTVRALRVDGHVISDDTQRGVLLFVLAYILCFVVCSLVMSLFGLPYDSATSAVATCMSNTGPGLGLVGGAETYSIVPPAGLLFLSFCMILGRLEVLTILVLLMPTFWRAR